MKEPQALIFDCDGTLADTMPLHWEAWSRVTLKYGIHFTEERFYALGGVPGRHILQMLAREQERTDFDPFAVAKEKEAEYLKSLPRVKAVPPVVAIAAAHRGRIPMAVASGGTRHAIRDVLGHLQIREWFGAIVTSEDVVHQKPAPDIFLEAARQLGVEPTCCRAFEDTDLGMEAIRAAGMDAVDIRRL